MSVDIKKRFDRIVDILIQLQSKRIIKAQELADRFDVSLRTIYRDIKSLEQAGVPIIGEAGTGYSLIEGYRLPPVVFTKEEALSFIGAEKLMDKFMDRSISTDYKSAVYKIRSVLKMSDKESLSTIENQIIMQAPSYQIFNQEVPHALQTFFESIAQQKRVCITYKGLSDTDAQHRTLEPIGLFHQHNYWYIIAYCLKRSDYRQFRADRIFQIELLNDKFQHSHISLADYIASSHKENPTIRIRIEVDSASTTYLNWEKNHYGFKEEISHGDRSELIFDCPYSIEAFARWYIMFADAANILEPILLKERVRDLLNKGLNRIQQHEHEYYQQPSEFQQS